MGNDERGFAAFRQSRGELQNDVIDEYASGRIGRRELLQRGAVLGMSASALAFVVSSCGGASSGSTPTSATTGSAAPAAPKQGGTLRVGLVTPTATIDPVTTGDFGGINLLLLTGEYLTISDPSGLKLQPVLAESWSPNADASVWTFKIRQGVTFNDGRPLTAKDVAATFNRLADPKNGSNALSAFKGILETGGAKAVDDATVRFDLQTPNGNFPYLVSSDNYNAIILPADYAGDFQKTFIGTGPMKLQRYTPGSGATFVRNAAYWDKANQPTLDGLEYRFYEGEQPQILALQGGEIDVIPQMTVGVGRSLLTDPNVVVIGAKSAATRALHMRTDVPPFNDKRIRQAVALTLDRPALVKTLFLGRAQVGNDSPFAPVFPSTDPSIPQRHQDIEQAKSLMAAAGKPNGFSTQLTAINIFEVPDYAVLVKNAAKQIGIDLKIQTQDSATYYGKSTYGSSPWLDSTMGITDYSHRGVPNVYLNAQLQSDGIWNSAHIKSPQLDKMISDYEAAVDLSAQRTAAGKIQSYLLDETPLIYGYFYNFLTATTPQVTGVVPRPGGRLFLAHAGLKA